MRTVNAAVAGGISSIATIHDSFGCLSFESRPIAAAPSHPINWKRQKPNRAKRLCFLILIGLT